MAIYLETQTTDAFYGHGLQQKAKGLYLKNQHRKLIIRIKSINVHMNWALYCIGVFQFSAKYFVKD